MAYRLVRDWLKREFTMRRWGTNPAQMYMISLLTIFSLLQIIIGGSPKASLLVRALEGPVATSVAVCNLMGGIVALYGLHTREFDRSIRVEAWGYLSLLTVMGTYVILLITHPSSGFPNLTFALALSEAFVLSSLHRVIQIHRYFRAIKRGDKIQVWAMLGRLDKDGALP